MILILIGALLIGLTLGLLGSGGSAITVPVLIYMVGHGAKQSITESMAIVGLISVTAAISYARTSNIDWRSVWYFGIPGMLGTYIGAWLGGISPESIQLVVFAVVLLTAAYMMLHKAGKLGKSGQSESGSNRESCATWQLALEGTGVGIITGFVGVGGGFLIVPALVMFARLPMRLAIGTSLVIITFNSAIGFAKYQNFLMAHDMSVDFQTVGIFVLTGVVGSLIGRSLNSRLNQKTLRQVFAVFLIMLGSFVMIREGSKIITKNTDQKTTVHSVQQGQPERLITQNNWR